MLKSCVHHYISEKKSGPTSVISKLGLDDWKLAVPVGLLVGMPALYNEVPNAIDDLLTSSKLIF
jgi:hypothetical protein